MYIIRRLSYYLPLHGKSRCVLFYHLKRRNAKGNSNFFPLCDVHYVKPTQKPFKTSLWQKEWKMNIGLSFQNDFSFFFFFCLRWIMAQTFKTYFCPNLLKVINKTALSSDSARECIWDRYFRVRAHRKYMRFCALKMNEGHMVDLEVVVYLKYREFHEKISNQQLVPTFQ